MEVKTRKHLLPFLLIFLFAPIAAVFSFCAPAPADEIFFKSGYSHTGVIIREKKDSITFKTEMGLSTISREKVDFIEKATPEENQELLKKWREQERKEKEAQENRREAERKFREEQLAKGLIEFEGRWVTSQEKDRVIALRKEASEHQRQFEEQQKNKGLVRFQYLWVTPDHAQELRRMESDIYRLYEEINDWRKTIDSLRTGMAGTGSIEEADKYTSRIDELNQKVNEATDRLGELLRRADEIEAASTRYVMPEKYREVSEPVTESN